MLAIRSFQLSDEEAVVAFHARLGYAEDDVLSLGRRLEHDDPPSTPAGRVE